MFRFYYFGQEFVTLGYYIYPQVDLGRVMFCDWSIVDSQFTKYGCSGWSNIFSDFPSVESCSLSPSLFTLLPNIFCSWYLIMQCRDGFNCQLVLVPKVTWNTDNLEMLNDTSFIQKSITSGIYLKVYILQNSCNLYQSIISITLYSVFSLAVSSVFCINRLAQLCFCISSLAQLSYYSCQPPLTLTKLVRVNGVRLGSLLYKLSNCI